MDQLIDSIYDVVLDDQEALPGLLADIADQAGACTAGLSFISSTERWGLSVIPRVDPNHVTQYIEQWAREDLVFDLLEAQPINRIGGVNSRNVALFKESSAYNESWRRSGLGVQRRFAKLHNDNALTVAFTLHAGERHDEIDIDGERVFAHLLPHIARASRLLQKQRRFILECQSNGFTNAFDIAGVFYTDANMALLYASRGGEEMLRQGDSFVLHNRHFLALRRSAENDLLKDAISRCANRTFQSGCDSIPIRSDKDQRLLTIEILPYSNDLSGLTSDILMAENYKAIIIVRDPVRGRQFFVSALSENFGLTYSETLLVLALLQGDGRQQAAERCGIALNTARAHLRNIYAKMGVSRQAELIAVIRDKIQLPAEW